MVLPCPMDVPEQLLPVYQYTVPIDPFAVRVVPFPLQTVTVAGLIEVGAAGG